MRLGAVKLEDFLGAKNLRPSKFAEQIGKSPSTISRILDGTNCPDVDTAHLIQQHTDGTITLDDWVQQTKKRPARK